MMSGVVSGVETDFRIFRHTFGKFGEQKEIPQTLIFQGFAGLSFGLGGEI